ncbi:hypothetical protein BDA96_04G140900 [Sorghum bicolor]|uniref:Uncharacterized protein n=2 Tax=Sorghum bicolor TaxID=4558 RepID=A0A921R3M9_SORBI|nr:uncharacterized protein LOC110434612 isoform X1 [Sorghum bicolor]KAG0532831.1 hypothetical protein BDA96_04G140900 [Sorghum bicolor]KXG30077.1 hypothetical protein SORBI_3004G131900 [Sorghum bicolor]|eukprot:XP_021314666.1 uncharacterized protein LOC110434612 isoform X1 [Sorghum bicolor]
MEPPLHEILACKPEPHLQASDRTIGPAQHRASACSTGALGVASSEESHIPSSRSHIPEESSHIRQLALTICNCSEDRSFIVRPFVSEAMCRSSPHPRRREGGRGAPGDAQGAACRARGSEAAGRSRSGLRPSCGLRPGRPQRAGGREVAERRTPEGGEERTGAEQSTPEGGMEAGEGGDRGGAVHAGGREAT